MTRAGLGSAMLFSCRMYIHSLYTRLGQAGSLAKLAIDLRLPSGATGFEVIDDVLVEPDRDHLLRSTCSHRRHRLLCCGIPLWLVYLMRLVHRLCARQCLLPASTHLSALHCLLAWR